MKKHPLMSDGRNFTNWQPTALVNETIRRREHLRTDTDYRAYLQNNAASIRAYNMSIAMAEVSNFPTVSYENTIGTPHLYTTKTLPPAPKYQTTDLKEWFFRMFKV